MNQEVLNLLLTYKRLKILKLRKKFVCPVWLFPTLYEREYHKRIKDFVFTMQSIFINQFDNQLKNIPEFKTDSIDDLETLIKAYKDTVDNTLTDDYIRQKIITGIPEGVSKQNIIQWQRIIKAKFGVNLIQTEPWLAGAIQSWTSENVTLIKTIKNRSFSRLESILQHGYRSGKRHETLKVELWDYYKKLSEYEARRISRDQIAKLNCAMMKTRQESFGVTRYTWQDSDDVRVRPTHKANDGQIFFWSKPSSITGHPGDDIQCRCWAEPIFDEYEELLFPEQVKNFNKVDKEAVT